MSPPTPRSLIRTAVPLPHVPIPLGRTVELPGRGSTYVTDTPGPAPDSPAVVLLHALGCTGLLTWFPSIGPLSERYRVITLDQRWHGRGISSDSFSLYDCADDVAALMDVLEIDRAMIAGFSMGSVISQRVWRQHRDRVTGLVLAATTDRFRSTLPEIAFHQGLAGAMRVGRGLSRSRSRRRYDRRGAQPPMIEVPDIYAWALAEFRQTSPWAVGQAVAALGRHHSRPWAHRIDVPTAFVINRKDHVIPASRQRAMAGRIPGATLHEIDAGHASCVLESEVFVPAFLEAVHTVHARAAQAAKAARAERD